MDCQAAVSASPQWTLPDLIDSNIIDIVSSKPDLRTPIHPLFEYRDTTWELDVQDLSSTKLIHMSKGRQVTASEWKVFEPGLRMASEIIETDAFLNFCLPLFLGELPPPTKDPDDPANILKLPSGDPRALRNQVKSILLTLAEHTPFAFREYKDDSWAETRYILKSRGDRIKGGVPHLPGLDVGSVRIDFDLKFLKFAQHYIQREAKEEGIQVSSNLNYESQHGDNTPPIVDSQFLRVNWLFGITMLHELIHAIWIARVGSREEPYHPMDIRKQATPRGYTRELGFAFEYSFWGFESDSITADYVAGDTDTLEALAARGFLALGLCVWMRGTGWPLPSHECAVCPLPMPWIASWFQEKTWQRVRAGVNFDPRAFMLTSKLVFGAKSRVEP